MLKSIWYWLRNEQWDKVFFYAFLLSSLFGWRKVFALYSPIAKLGFGEYWDISMYIPDLFLLASLILNIIQHKYKYKSISNIKCLFHVEQIRPFFVFYFCLISYSALSSLWSSIPEIALFSSLQMARPLLFCITALILFVPRGTNNEIKSLSQKRESVENILYSLLRIAFIVVFIQITISLLQLYNQQSIGLKWLGESELSINSVNIAKIESPFGLFIRPYGTFPHPNVLGGFMGMVLLLSLIMKKYFFMFHVEHKTVRNMFLALNKRISKTEIFPGYKNTDERLMIVDRITYYFGMFHVEHLLLNLVVIASTIGLIVSFSKSAVMGTIVSIVFLEFLSKDQRSEMFHVEQLCGNSKKKALNRPIMTFIEVWQSLVTIYKCSGKVKNTIQGRDSVRFHVEHFILVILVVALLSTFYLQYGPTMQTSITDREEQFTTIFTNNGIGFSRTMFGIGFGQSVIEKSIKGEVNFWNLQPVHNVFLLMFQEIGITGLFLFFAVLASILYVPRGTYLKASNAIILYIIFLGMFDHYLITLYHGTLTLAISITCVIVINLTSKTNRIK